MAPDILILRVRLVNPQTVVKGSLEGCMLVKHFEASRRLRNVGVSSSSIVNIVYTLGMDRWNLVSGALSAEVESS